METFQTAVVKKAEGEYRQGLEITTDPAARWNPKEGTGPVFVDPARFNQWRLDGYLRKVSGAATEQAEEEG